MGRYFRVDGVAANGANGENSVGEGRRRRAKKFDDFIYINIL
jgi:hypothetical protein